MIIIHIDNISKDDLDVKYAIDELLRSHGFAVAHHDIGMLSFMTADKPTNAVPVTEPAIEKDTPEPPAPEMEITLASPEVAGVAAEPVAQNPEAPVFIPPEEPQKVLAQCDDITLVGLTSSCTVKCMYGNPEKSELHVQNLNMMGDYAAFTYCGLSFKYPLLDERAPNIRVVVRYRDFERALLLKLIDATECMVVLSKEDYALVSEDMLNDKVPTQ